MNLRELAEINGISISTAKRYKRDGVDLRNRKAVESHMFAQRTRRGVSKYFRRTASVAQQAVTIATQNLEGVVEELESKICGVHSEVEWLLKHHPELASDLADAFSYTAPVVERIGAEE
jgi:predicted site-specific integrase-resolvase